MMAMADRRAVDHLAGRLIQWYLSDCPFQRGKGFVNRLLGRFLTLEVLDGVRLRFTNPNEFIQRSLLSGGDSYEPEVTSVLARSLVDGSVFFDVGANLGFFALLASRRVGLTGEVHAFEPAPEQFGQLRRNVELNRAVNVRLNNCALADSPGLRAFYLSAGWNRGTHSFGSTPERRSSIQVTCETFDDYVTRRGVHHVDVVKIDVEGAELLVLRGARACIRSQPPSLMIVEAAQAHAQSLGYSTIDLKAYLAENGYEIYRLQRASKPVRAAIGTAESYANLAAIHQTAPARYRDALFGSWAQSGTGAAQPPSKD